MIRFYYNPSPNPAKVALFLEESGLPYELVPVDTGKGEQFSPDFVALNPNSKVPALVDGDVRVFDSSAILLYLAEKTGQFLPDQTPQARAELYSWLMFVASGIGPFSGQAVHFKHYAPAGLEYALNRYQYEARRHYAILDAQLTRSPYLLGSAYTIADMSAWGWVRVVPYILGEGAFGTFPHLNRWLEKINARPAALRANALKDKFKFRPPTDEGSKRHMFRHLANPT